MISLTQTCLLRPRPFARTSPFARYPTSLAKAGNNSFATAAKKAPKPSQNPYQIRKAVPQNSSQYQGPITVNAIPLTDKPTLVYKAPHQRLFIGASVAASCLLFGAGAYMLIWMNQDEGKYFPAWMRMGYTAVGVLLLGMCAYILPLTFNVIKTIRLLPSSGKLQDLRRVQLEIKSFPLPLTKTKKIEGHWRDFRSSTEAMPLFEVYSKRSKGSAARFFNYTKMLFSRDGVVFVEYKGRDVGKMEVAGFLLDNGKGISIFRSR